MNFDDDAFGPSAQGVIKTGIKRAVACDGATNANHGNNKGSCTKNEDGDLAAGARQECLDPLAAKFVAQRHRYFPFGASASR